MTAAPVARPSGGIKIVIEGLSASSFAMAPGAPPGQSSSTFGSGMTEATAPLAGLGPVMTNKTRIPVRNARDFSTFASQPCDPARISVSELRGL